MSLVPARFARFFRFCTVGLSSTTIEWGLLALLTDVAGWKPLVANPLCYVLAVTNGFYWNRRWTFSESKGEEPAGQYVRFVLVNLVGMLLDQAVLAVALAVGPQAGLGPDVSKWAGKLVSMPFIVAWNFTINSLWTFGTRRRTPLSEDAIGREKAQKAPEVL